MLQIESNLEKIIRKIISNYVDKELNSTKAQIIDNNKTFPNELFKKLADIGIFNIRYMKQNKIKKTTLYCIICEELARGLMSIAATVAMQCLMGTNFLFHYSSKKMIRKFFNPAMRGEKIGSFCLTEPESGSDLGSVTTSCKKHKDGFIINGVKTWVTNGPKADFFTVLCQTNPDKKLKGLSFCFVPKNLDGVNTSLPFKCVGTTTTPICEVFFNNVFIPNEYCLIPEKNGLSALISILSEIRTMTAALGIGLQRAAIKDSITYAKERTAFGKTISKYQLIQAKISKMIVNLEASKLMVYNSANMIDKQIDCIRESSIAKFFSTESACLAADYCTRIFGAYGYSLEYTAQRYYRDSRFLLNGGGTHEVLLTDIAKFEGL